MTRHEIVAHFRQLPSDEQLELLQQLWDEVAQDLEGQPASDAEKEFLDRRLQDIAADSRESTPWPSLRSDLQSKR